LRSPASEPYRAWTLGEIFGIFSALEYLMDRGPKTSRRRDADGRDRACTAGAPGLVLLDEPSQGLAPKIVGDVLATIERL
jgi:branched-chain amino acid transport system ATP-binding protein